MSEKIQFELVSPIRLLKSDQVDMVVVPGEEGNFGAMAQHAPLISLVRPGVIETYNNGTIQDRIFISGGFAEVSATRCVILADEAFNLADVDASRLETDLAAAETALAESKDESARAHAKKHYAVLQAMKQAVESKPR